MDSQRLPGRGGHGHARLAVLSGLLVLSLIFWRPIGRSLTTSLALKSDSLNETVFRELAATTRDPSSLVNRAWSSGKIPHRQAVVRLLKNEPELQSRIREGENILLRAGRDGDATVRELALAALAEAGHRALPNLLEIQMRDPDPDLRRFALEYLRRLPAERAIPLIGPALDDKELTVASTAGVILQSIAGRDFGIRVPREPGGSIEREWRDLFERQRVDAKAWLASNREKFTPLEVINLLPPDHRFAVSDFVLRDLDERLVRLSDFRGKTVLLNFWTTWCTSCVAEFPILNELQKRHPEDLAIIGIALDEYSESGGDSQGATAGSLEQVKSEVKRAVSSRGLQYVVLLDPEVSVGARFNGGELPTNVLIDGSGRFVRRFIGPRSVEAFEEMILETR